MWMKKLSEWLDGLIPSLWNMYMGMCLVRWHVVILRVTFFNSQHFQSCRELLGVLDASSEAK